MLVAGWWALDTGAARELFTALRDAAWDWTPAEVRGVVERLGWRLVEEVPEKGAVAGTPSATGRDDVTILYRGDRVRIVRIGATSRGGLPVGAETAQLADEEYDRLVAVGRELLGPPVLRIDGEERFAHWRGERDTITVAQGTATVFVEWAPNEFEHEWLKSGTVVG